MLLRKRQTMLGYTNSSEAWEGQKVSSLLALEWCSLSWTAAAHYRCSVERINWRGAGGEW